MAALPKLVGLALGAALTTGCSEDGVTDPSVLQLGDPASVAGSPMDIGGEWSWSKTEQLTFPAWVAAMFGIDAEGPVTRGTCAVSGTMTVEQTGSTFTGEVATVEQGCVTTGGQPFLEGGGTVGPIIDGRIRGRSIFMQRFGNGVVCDFHAVASEIEGGIASLLDGGGGNCLVPGHPQNPLPFPPPPGGTNIVMTWTAVRQ